MNSSHWLRLLALVVSGIFWIAFVAVPLILVLLRAFQSGVGGGLETVFDSLVLSVARVTANQALLSTFFSSLLGLGLGLAAVRFPVGARNLLAIPYGVPTVVAATAWVILLGKSAWAYSLKAVILAHVFYNIPFVALMVSQAAALVPRSEIQAARTLGANNFSIFRFVVWPRVKWDLASASAQVFALCSMSFALVLILGGGPPVETLETALYGKLRYGTLDLSGAAACAFWELLLTLIPWGMVMVLRGETPVPIGTTMPVSFELERGKRRWIASLAWIGCGLFCLPYFSVFDWRNLVELLGSATRAELRDPLVASLILAAFSSVGALLIAAAAVLAGRPSSGATKWRMGFSTLAALPSGISVLVLGLGAWLGYGRWLDPFGERWAAILAIGGLQIAIFYPVAYRMLWPVANKTSGNILEAAATLGASPWKAFWLIDWPRWRGPVFAALAIVAGASLGEVAAVSLFYNENLIPLSLQISRWMGQYRFEQAQALSALLFVLSAGTIAAVSIWGSNRISNCTTRR